MREIVLVVHDIRSCHNVGSLLRTAEGLGISKVYFTGYTPYPVTKNDDRLPHISRKLTEQIHKTALGAEISQPWEHHPDITELLTQLRKDGFALDGLEQDINAVPLHSYTSPEKVALVLGSEVTGMDPALLKLLDLALEIPMFGQKESFNVVQAAAMALHQLRFH
jgi:23S rRNA (guanosine2251-2'-O)-methyltransferase